jgi:primosomal protein N'
MVPLRFTSATLFASTSTAVPCARGLSAPGEERDDLKEIKRWLSRGPSEDVVDLTAWCAWRYCAARSRFLSTGSPERRVTQLSSPAPWPSATLLAPGEQIQPGLLSWGPARDPLPVVLSALEKARVEGGTALVVVPHEGWAQRLTARLLRRGIAACRSRRLGEGSIAVARCGRNALGLFCPP